MIPLLIGLAVIFFGVPGIYYLYLRYESSKPWDLKLDLNYFPKVTIIVPARNEEKTIKFKLMNLNKVEYPKEKMQIILINDASTDTTVLEASRFLDAHRELDLEIITQKTRTGKAVALNVALAHAENEIVIVSDADTFWAPDILTKSLPFLSDSSIGALNGRQTLFEIQRSLLTQTEKMYLNLTYETIKQGESKIYSTILFHGLFSAYKRKFLKGFSLENDDSGTALDIVQNGARAIYVPGAICYEIPPQTWKGKIKTKIRRATQLIELYVKCLKLLFKKRLLLPLRISIPEIAIYLINPLVFILLVCMSLFYLATHPIYLMYVSAVVLLLLVVQRFRLLFVEGIQDNCILLIALLNVALRRRFSVWETLEESRSMLTEERLAKENLI
jgi:biofilm PGA synthesis N-glycosyltransferase PgaC